MYVTAIVQAGGNHNALTVPDAAVLRTAENEPFVYVVEDPAKPNQFGQRLVSVGDSQGGKTQILSGLRQAKMSPPMAACSCSLRIRSSDRAHSP